MLNIEALLRTSLVATMVATFASPVTAQEYRTETVRVIVTWKAGGGTDSIACGLNKALDQLTDQSVIVENLTGGAGARHSYVCERCEP